MIISRTIAAHTVDAVGRGLPHWKPAEVEHLVAATRSALRKLDPVLVVNAKAQRMEQWLAVGSLGTSEQARDQLVAIGALRPDESVHDVAFASLLFVPRNAPASTALAGRSLGATVYGKEAAILDPALLTESTISPYISAAPSEAARHVENSHGARPWARMLEAVSIRVGAAWEKAGHTPRATLDADFATQFLTSSEVARTPFEAVVRDARAGAVRAILHERGAPASPEQASLIATSDSMRIPSASATDAERVDRLMAPVLGRVGVPAASTDTPTSRVRSSMNRS